jgi:glycosyltransferase involved in cell wall biosynthesis
MRLLMVSDYFHPYLLGGGERRMYEIAKRLAKRHEVHVVTRRLGSAPAYERHEGIHIHRVFTPSRKPALESFVDGLCFMLAAFFKVLRLGDFDWYAPQQFFPLVPIWVASRVKGRPIVATIHDVYGGRWIENYGLRSCPMILFEHISLRLPYSKIVTISKASKGKLVASKVPEWRIEIIPNGVDLAAFNGVKVEKSRKPRVIYVGRLIGYKHIDDLLRAFSGLDLDAELYVVGEGPERKRLEGLVEELGLRERVTFTGFVDERRKMEFLKSSWALVLPSSIEGFGIVVVEAWASHTAVVVSDIPALGALVEDGKTGLIFKLRDVKGLKEKLERMLRDEGLRERLSKEGYELVKRIFDWNKVAAETELIFKTCVRKA